MTGRGSMELYLLMNCWSKSFSTRPAMYYCEEHVHVMCEVFHD